MPVNGFNVRIYYKIIFLLTLQSCKRNVLTVARFNGMGNPEKNLCDSCKDSGFCNVAEMIDQSEALRGEQPEFYEVMRSSIEQSYIANGCPNVDIREKEVTENQKKPLKDFLQLHHLPSALRGKFLKPALSRQK
jgi:hypothetical protein